MRKTEPLNHHIQGDAQLDWTILRSGHDLDHTNLSCMRCRVGDCWGRYCIAQSRTYQVEFGVPCLIGTECPSSRVQQTAVGEVGGTTGWHGAWGT